MRWYATLFFVLVFLMTGCGPREPVPSRTEPDLSAAPAAPTRVTAADSDLRSAPVEVTVQGAPLRIGAELWRDYMPVSPPEGRPLAGVVWVWASDRAVAGPVPDADRAWVLHGDSAWETVPVKEPPPAESDSFLSRYAIREGPLWGPAAPVHVVLRLRGEDGNPILIRTEATIARTD